MLTEQCAWTVAVEKHPENEAFNFTVNDKRCKKKWSRRKLKESSSTKPMPLLVEVKPLLTLARPSALKHIEENLSVLPSVSGNFTFSAAHILPPVNKPPEEEPSLSVIPICWLFLCIAFVPQMSCSPAAALQFVFLPEKLLLSVQLRVSIPSASHPDLVLFDIVDKEREFVEIQACNFCWDGWLLERKRRRMMRRTRRRNLGSEKWWSFIGARRTSVKLETFAIEEFSMMTSDGTVIHPPTRQAVPLRLFLEAYDVAALHGVCPSPYEMLSHRWSPVCPSTRWMVAWEKENYEDVQ